MSRISNTFTASLIALSLSCCFYQKPVSAQNPYMEQALAAYNSGDFNTTLHYLNTAANSEFNNPLFHYYLADTLVHLGRHEEALKEYRIAYTLNPSSSVANYCKLALSRYGTGTEPQIWHEKGEAKNSGPDAQLVQSVSVIHKQTEDSKNIMIQGAHDRSTNALRSTDENIKTSQRQTQQMINDLQAQSLSLDPGSARRAAASINAQSEEQQKGLTNLKRNTDRIASESMKDAVQRSLYVEQSATNLEQMMVAPHKAGDVVLDKNGTNLYVRNYSSSISSTATPKEASQPQDNYVSLVNKPGLLKHVSKPIVRTSGN
jgi:tetratricopeptide (TPR) repeat protein